MKRYVLTCAAAAALGATLAMGASPAAATIVADDFDDENGGTPKADITDLKNFTIGFFGTGTADLLGPGRIGNVCAGGVASLCVGVDENSQLNYKSLITFNAGDQVGIAFDIRRSVGADYGNFRYTFQSQSGFLQFQNIETNLNAQSAYSTQGFSLETTNQAQLSDVFETKHLRFTADRKGSVTFFFSALANGAIVDNFTLQTSSGAVPEPTTWILLILGLGALGGRMRRRMMPGFGQAAV